MSRPILKPIRKELQMPVQTILQSRLHNVVVKDKETARKCVQVLKRWRQPNMDFLHKELRFRQPDPRMREITRGNAEAAMDCVEYDQKHAEVVKFLLGNTMFVDRGVEMWHNNMSDR